MKRIIPTLCCLLTVFVVSAQKNIELLSHYTFPNGVECSNLTGYADSSGREYALVGTTRGLEIVDITDPVNPDYLFLVPGATGQGGGWREVATYKGFAYVTTEQSSGLVVVNLNYLPDSIGYHTINPGNMQTSHTVFIDEKGYAYINGTDQEQLFLDLNANAWNPPLRGRFTNNYVHDCFVRNDTMWAACINDGFMKVVNVANKTNTNAAANTLATWNTPLNFSHNIWLSDDGKYVFTTDEKPSSYLTCYDVSDLENVTETDRTQVEPGSNTIIHNTYFKNDYCVSSYYTYGITIHDVSRKNNLVEVGNFDTSPFTGDGFNGAWGVWPFLPSGNLIISDIENGLWVVKPTYVRACYVEGTVTDSVCGTQLNNVLIEIVSTNVQDHTNFLGKYSTGTPDSGTYTIRFSKPGYQTKELQNVTLDNGVLSTLNIALVPSSTARMVIKTVDANTGNALGNIRVLIADNTGATYRETATNTNGLQDFCDFVQGTYGFYAGRWGKITAKVNHTVNTATDTVTIAIGNGYYDDFIMDYGWTVSSTATSGDWERGEPIGTEYLGDDCNPGVDATGDYGLSCFVTGNNGGEAGDDDVDNGYTTLISPIIDLSGYIDPYINYSRWFFNSGGSSTANDQLTITITNGTDTATLENITATTDAMSQWNTVNLKLRSYLSPTANMRLYIRAVDTNPGHLVEAGFDKFSIVDSATITNIDPIFAEEPVDITVRPNPFTTTASVVVENNLTSTIRLGVYDNLGIRQEGYQAEPGTTVLSVGRSLAAGSYIIKVETRGSQASEKLIKQ